MVKVLGRHQVSCSVFSEPNADFYMRPKRTFIPEVIETARTLRQKCYLEGMESRKVLVVGNQIYPLIEKTLLIGLMEVSGVC